MTSGLGGGGQAWKGEGRGPASAQTSPARSANLCGRPTRKADKFVRRREPTKTRRREAHLRACWPRRADVWRERSRFSRAAADVFSLSSRPGAGGPAARWTGFATVNPQRAPSGTSLKAAVLRALPARREASAQKQRLVFEEPNVNTMYFTRSFWQADGGVSGTSVYF